MRTDAFQLPPQLAPVVWWTRAHSLQLGWYPQSEHGGFIVARLLGWDKLEGLDRILLPLPSPNTAAPRRLRAEFFKVVRNHPGTMARNCRRMTGHDSALAFAVHSR